MKSKIELEKMAYQEFADEYNLIAKIDANFGSIPEEEVVNALKNWLESNQDSGIWLGINEKNFEKFLKEQNYVIEKVKMISIDFDGNQDGNEENY